MNEVLGLLFKAQVNFFLLIFCVEVDSLDIAQFDRQFQDESVEENRYDLKSDCLLRVFSGQQVSEVPVLPLNKFQILVDLLDVEVKLKSLRFYYF